MKQIEQAAKKNYPDDHNDKLFTPTVRHRNNNCRFGCDPLKGNKQTEAVHDAFVCGMKKMREILLPHITQKANTKE